MSHVSDARARDGTDVHEGRELSGSRSGPLRGLGVPIQGPQLSGEGFGPDWDVCFPWIT